MNNSIDIINQLLLNLVYLTLWYIWFSTKIRISNLLVALAHEYIINTSCLKMSLLLYLI
jgi:hypothetical protein